MKGGKLQRLAPIELGKALLYHPIGFPVFWPLVFCLAVPQWDLY